MGRSIAAVVFGFLYALTTIWLTQLVLYFVIPESPDDTIPPIRLALTVVSTFLAAVLAGFMAAHIARRGELVHGLAVGAILVILLALTTLVAETEPAPRWYQLALPLTALPGTLLGAALRAKVRRPPPPAPPNSAS
jgi:putative membrane protein (TIGR04086 family)